MAVLLLPPDHSPAASRAGREHVKLSYVFIYQAVISLVFGIVALAVPATLGSTYGASLDQTARTLAQYFGAAYISIGLVSWFLRNAPPSTERLAVVRSLAIGALLSLVPDAVAISNGLVNALGWLNVALAIISTLGFGYYGVMKTRMSEVTATP
jgi:hypothetical protein